LISLEHFTIDGTLIDAWARLKGFRRNVEKRERRSPENERAISSVDLQAEILPDSPDVIAWNKARSRHTLELLAAIASVVSLIAMFVLFSFILTK